MSWLRRVLSEPFAHFLLIGAVIFVAYAALNRDAEEVQEETIVVSAGQIDQIYEIYSRTWQRPPTLDELRGLIDTHVKEEIYYREGRKLGLDENDTVVRRRLQQKMEFLIEPSAAELTPDDGELEAFLEANRGNFRLPPQYAFEQIYFSPERRGEAVAANATEALARLQAGKAVPADLGDPTMLPARMGLTPVGRIELSFGADFVDGLTDAPVGPWSGPIRSSFGLHLFKIGDKVQARDPRLSEVIDKVTRAWEDQRRGEIADRRYAEMAKNYAVVVEMPEVERDAKAEKSVPAVAEPDGAADSQAM